MKFFALSIITTGAILSLLLGSSAATPGLRPRDPPQDAAVRILMPKLRCELPIYYVVSRAPTYSAILLIPCISTLSILHVFLSPG